MTEKSVADPDVAGLIERLNGRYTIPVNDGAGLLNGKDTFSRTFTVPSIQLEAAAALQRQADQLAAAQEALGKPVAWVVTASESIPYPHIERLVDIGTIPAGTKLYAIAAAQSGEQNG